MSNEPQTYEVISYVLWHPGSQDVRRPRAVAEVVRLYIQSETERRHIYQRPAAVDGVAVEDRYDDDYDACIYCDHDWHGVRCESCVCRSSFLEEGHSSPRGDLTSKIAALYDVPVSLLERRNPWMADSGWEHR